MMRFPRLLLLLTLGVGLGAPALHPSPAAAQDDKAEEVVPPTDEEIAEEFAKFTAAIAKGEKGVALDMLFGILNDPEKQGFHGQAWLSMGGVLATMDYPYASLIAYTEGIKVAPERSKEAVEAALRLADQVHDTALLEQVFAANVGLPVDGDTRSHLAYLAARGNYAQGNYATALGIMALVGKDSPQFAQAQALRGVVLSQQGKYNEAMAALLVAEQLSQDDPERLDVIRLNLGRTFYAAENYPKAIEYYALVSRESPWWPEAQFERAWGHFRIQDMNGTLGLLQNHVSPFYADWYFPEAHILRTYALFLLCKFPEASAQIDTFQATWTPVRDELEKTLAGMDDAAAFADARAYAEGEDTRIPAMLLRHYPSESRFQEAVASVDAAEREIQAISARSGDWAKPVVAMVQARHDAIVAAEGGRVREGAQAASAELTQMLNDTELAKLDMLKLETRLYEQAAQSGQMAGIEKKARRDVRVRKGYVSWPYEGEIWADEIGYYRVNAIPECPQGLMGAPQ
ncbi:MAG: tetratricopeptide repeat protein [Alphaproteobacteria bacterium]|nr:tetratricopeptide repeat protein [Alphaproteobacteria bacterium]